VLDRHYEAARLYGADIVVKIPSDCPLIDPVVIDKVISFFLNNRYTLDYASNLHPASYPDGNDVEVMHFDALETAWRNAAQDFEREHTTPYIWERPEMFKTGNVCMEGGVDYSLTQRWTIDYPEDYVFIKRVYDELYEKNALFGVANILKLVEQHNDIYTINSHLAGVNWYRHHLGQLKTISALQTKIL
jgi:spore coat polysaccharide biosynthesis protein SpsF